MTIRIQDYGQITHDNKQFWYYWVYADNGSLHTFLQWCYDNLSVDSKTIHRYNSGYPMVEVTIPNDNDQALFKLRWSNEKTSLDA